jgi:RNA polymerase sigma-70 factor (ECF subfamily)
VALLSRRFGTQYIDEVEDAVQWALTQAIDSWHSNKPDNPTAWLYRVACRHIISELRTHQRRTQLLQTHHPQQTEAKPEDADIPFAQEIADSMLRMLFVACHPKIPVESQLVFTLKSLCGFSIKEISIRLFLSEANVYKRFSRAKQYLQGQTDTLDALTDDTMVTRLTPVHSVLYLVFTEGYLSSHVDTAIREDLCHESFRLTHLLSKSPYCNAETDALLALITFHLARMSSRGNQLDGLLLLEEQDRSLWDKKLVHMGMSLLAKSARGHAISRYHIEASIAAEHCLAPSLKETRWDKIVEAYELLEHIAASPMYSLNRAIALAEWKGPEAGIALLKSTDTPIWLERSYYWYAVKADLLYRCNDTIQAIKYTKLAIANAPTEDIKHLLTKRTQLYQ